jgi:holo-[acyl-carrier protein] synthase
VILGTGIDIVETRRIADSLKRFGDRFLDRIFHEAEVAYARSMKKADLHLAARFAAKEAISKAFGTGIGSQLGWKDMEIRRRDTGEPYVVLHGKALDLMKARGATSLHVSLSHTDNYAAASAVLEGKKGG